MLTRIGMGSYKLQTESTFLRSREIFDNTFEDVSEEEKMKITGGIIAQLYSFS